MRTAGVRASRKAALRPTAGQAGLRFYLFDDGIADEWDPFALTRPCGELRYGALLLRERLERFAGRPAAGTVTRPWLAAFSEPQAPPVVPHPSDPTPHPRLYLCSRAVPADDARLSARPDRPLTILVGGGVAGCVVPAGTPPPAVEWFGRPERIRRAEAIEVEGAMPSAPWSLVADNAARLARDLSSAAGGDATIRLPRGAHKIGRAPIRLGPDVRIEPGTLLDVREGPIHLEEGTEVRFGARLAGPLYAGPGCRLLGGALSRLSAGPRCYLQGEVEESIILGYANKAHDGFLGHAMLGCWVNLGAGTTNSDLKNNYGTVRMAGARGEVDTGLLKMGCLIGDHAKTAIGTLLTTGTVIGAGASVFGGSPSKRVSPFSWGGTPDSPVWRQAEFLRTAEIVMGRRGVVMDEAARRCLSAAWEEATRGAGDEAARNDGGTRRGGRGPRPTRRHGE